jgi:hypothetical protein
MGRPRTCVRIVLASGFLILSGCLTLATGAQALGWLACGPQWDYCVAACDDNVPGGPPLAICHHYCNTGVSVCEANRIPVPASYRSHPRPVPARK